MCSNKIFAQVGMTTNNPHKSAALDLKATKDQGILIPNVNLVSTTDVSAIAGGVPAQSLLVYNTNSGITGTGASGTGYYYWDTNIWKKLSTATDITTGTASVTSPNATINVSGTNTVFGATTVDIKPGSNNTVMTTNGSGGVVWAPFTALGDNLGNHTATQRLNMSNFSVFGADTLIAKNAQLSNLQPGAATDSILTINPVTGDVRKIAPSSVASSVAWGLTGNTGTNPATNYLGTIDAKDMVVRTNNAERMRLTSAGSVGIGTATPKSKLSVSGGAISQDDFTDGDKFLLLGNTNAAKITHNLGWIFGNYAGANVDAAGNPVSTSSGVFTWNVSQTGAWAEIMRLTNTGSLGVGTNAPTAKLDIAGNARIRALPVGILTDSVVTADINGNLRKIAMSSMGDNLGNHRATTTLHMANNNIDSIYNAYIQYALVIRDRNAGYTKDFILYKNNGTFGIYNNTNSRNELSIDSATGKTTLTSAAISKGTDGSVPGAGSIATSADVSGNIIWKPASSLGSASVSSPNATINISGTNTVLGATTVDIKPGANNTVMTTNGSGVVTWVPGNTMDTAMIAGSNINIVRNAGGNTISATDTAMVAGAGIGIIRNASGNTISVTGGTNSVTSPNATVNVTGTNTVLGATTIDIKPGGNNTVMTTNGSGVVTWVPNNTLDTAMIAGSNISIVRNAGGNTISATDTAMVAGAGIGIIRNASGNTISVTGGTNSVTSPNATVSVTGTNTVLGATTIDIKPGGNNTVMTTDGTGSIIWKAPSAIGGTASVTSPNATVNVTGTNTVLGATTIDIKPGGNNTIMTTNGSGVVTWVPSNTIDTAMIAGSNISIVRNAGGNTISATDTAMIAGTGIGITRSASGNTIAVTGGNSSVTSPNATINVSGTNTVLGATTIDIKAGGNNTVMTTNGSGSVTWAPVSSLGDNLGNHTATQRLNMNNFSVYGADTLIANKARLTALTAGAATDSVLTVNTVTGDVRRVSAASFGDNLGNHRATTTLHMANNTIDSIYAANVYYQANIYDRMAANTYYMSLYKNNGTFGVWNSKRSTNEISIDETSGKTTLTSCNYQRHRWLCSSGRFYRNLC